MAGLLRLYRKLTRVPNDLQLYDAIAAGRVHPTLALTCRGKTDGAGAQANACISAMAVAEATGLTYLHTPFQRVEHAEGDPDEWTRKWEEFFGLGEGERVIPPEHEAVGLKAFLDQPKLWRREGLTLAAPHYQGVCNAHPDLYTAIIPRLRRKYAAHDKSRLALDRGDEQVTVAIHIRRGDVSKSDPVTSGRFTDDARIAHTVSRLQNAIMAQGLTARCHIYSEGRPEDFARFTDLGCRLHVGRDAFETIHNLAMSDVLVAAKSAFSFVAGLLSEGVKLYEPYDTAAPRDWLVLAADGGFDESLFAARLAR